MTAKYGFWESLHIFSSVIIFSLTNLIETITPIGTVHSAQDILCYNISKDLLTKMATAGNFASKGHVKMLEQIDQMMNAPLHNNDAQEALNDNEVAQWLASISNSDYLFNDNDENWM